MLRLKILACKVLYREISLLSANSENIVDTTYLRQGYHDTPDLLRKLLQQNIDAIDAGNDYYSHVPGIDGDFDAIMLGYGLCSNSIVGIKSQRYKLVIPRAHDCITLLVGSRDGYKEYFDAHSGGVYWYTAGWNENSIMPGPDRINNLRSRYIEKYGEENADFLMESEQNWLKEYKICTFIDWPELDNQRHIEYMNSCASFLNWKTDILEGNSSLLKKFISGDWNDKDFLVVPPGKSVLQSFDDGILTYSN